MLSGYNTTSPSRTYFKPINEEGQRIFQEKNKKKQTPGAFFGKSVALFFGIYLVYFAVTYIGFKRNVKQE